MKKESYKNRPIGLPEKGFVRLPQVLSVIPVSRDTWYRWINEGKAPTPIKLSAQISAWNVDSIHQFIDDLSKS